MCKPFQQFCQRWQPKCSYVVKTFPTILPALASQNYSMEPSVYDVNKLLLCQLYIIIFRSVNVADFPSVYPPACVHEDFNICHSPLESSPSKFSLASKAQKSKVLFLIKTR
jgi:hypothetical protein